jgi:hypothetical protein
MKIHQKGSSISPGDALSCTAGPISPLILFVSPPVTLLSDFLRHRNARDIDSRRQPFSPEKFFSMLQMWNVGNLPRALENIGLSHLKPAGGRRWDRAILEGLIAT